MVASYYGRQSIAKLTAQPYFMIIDWLLIALSHTVQSVLNLIINVELIYSFLYFITIIIITGTLSRLAGTVEAQIMYCMQYSRPLQCLS